MDQELKEIFYAEWKKFIREYDLLLIYQKEATDIPGNIPYDIVESRANRNLAQRNIIKEQRQILINILEKSNLKNKNYLIDLLGQDIKKFQNFVEQTFYSFE